MNSIPFPPIKLLPLNEFESQTQNAWIEHAFLVCRIFLYRNNNHHNQPKVNSNSSNLPKNQLTYYVKKRAWRFHFLWRSFPFRISNRPLITRWILMQTIFNVIVRLIEGVWGLFVKLCQFQATRLLPCFPVHGETEGKKEKEEKHGSSKNAKSIRGFVTFQSLVFFFKASNGIVRPLVSSGCLIPWYRLTITATHAIFAIK